MKNVISYIVLMLFLLPLVGHAYSIRYTDEESDKFVHTINCNDGSIGRVIEYKTTDTLKYYAGTTPFSSFSEAARSECGE